ncbi:pilin [bacterium]|nr:pilin [bacterium]
MKRILLTLLFSLIIIFPGFVQATIGNDCETDINCGEMCEECDDDYHSDTYQKCILKQNDLLDCYGPCQECINSGGQGTCSYFSDYEQHGCDAGFICGSSSTCEEDEGGCLYDDQCGTCEECTNFECVFKISDPDCSGPCDYCERDDYGRGACLQIVAGYPSSACENGYVCGGGSNCITECAYHGGECQDLACSFTENIVKGCGDEGNFCCKDYTGDTCSVPCSMFPCEAHENEDTAESACSDPMKYCCVPKDECTGGSKKFTITDTLDGCPVGYKEDQDATLNLPDNMYNQICCQKNEDYKPSTVANVGKLFEGIPCITDGNCSTEDLVQLAINVSKLLTGFVGSVALLFFIIAGVKLIFSAGKEESVKSAKEMMVQTIIGLFIFLGAYLIILFLQDNILGTKQKYRIDKKGAYNNESQFWT